MGVGGDPQRIPTVKVAGTCRPAHFRSIEEGVGRQAQCPSPPLAVALSAGLALSEACGGLTLAYYTDWPTSFWISALSGMVFLGAARGFAG
jgi:hypothetical protein